MYTKHGHQVPGTTVEPEPTFVQRCGGVGLCTTCTREASQHSQLMMAQEYGLPYHEPRPRDPKELAVNHVFEYVKRRLEVTDTHVTFARDEVYVVWFAFVLGNWKALISTTLPDGMYYEVTYNSEKMEIYLDAYKKFDHTITSVENLV